MLAQGGQGTPLLCPGGPLSSCIRNLSTETKSAWLTGQSEGHLQSWGEEESGKTGLWSAKAKCWCARDGEAPACLAFSTCQNKSGLPLVRIPHHALVLAAQSKESL